jgi:CheY-like chemotaxis protein
MTDRKSRAPRADTQATSPTPEIRPARRASARPSTALRKKILLVDDSATSLMLQTMILSSEPYDLVTATNGKHALDVAEREKPDLILMDMVMPQMGGLEACRAIRTSRFGKNIPVILVTTRGEPMHVRAAYEHGCTDYVTKPIDRAELLAKVRAYLGGRS